MNQGTILAWLFAFLIFGPILLAAIRVVYAAWLYFWHAGNPANWDFHHERDERPMTAAEYQAQVEAERRAADLRRLEIMQESWDG